MIVRCTPRDFSILDTDYTTAESVDE